MHTRLGTFESTTLAGEPMRVPDDLTGPTLLLFAYRQWQQRDVDTWLRAASDLEGLSTLEVPVLGRKWAAARSFIDGGMASGMDLHTRQTTMCVYTDVHAFRRDVLGARGGAIVATLVDADGMVLWHARGPAGPDSSAAMLEVAAAVLAGDIATG